LQLTSSLAIAAFFCIHLPPTPLFSPLPLHAALPICPRSARKRCVGAGAAGPGPPHPAHLVESCWTCRRKGQARARGLGGLRSGADRKSTRLNSSHVKISYAVFCLKKKK